MSTTPPLHPTDLGTILSVWAHPDDETYLAGGLMAAAVDAGPRVVCVSATAGEHGTDDPATGRRTGSDGCGAGRRLRPWRSSASPTPAGWATPTVGWPPSTPAAA